MMAEENVSQIDGVAMGSPIGPTLANIFLSHHESQWLIDCPASFKPTLYKRYVDDTFLLFKSQDHIFQFLTYLNNKHQNIKFTHEIEQDNKLSFLDMTIAKHNNNFTTSIYRKSTFTGLGLHFLSFSPIIFKINGIKTLIHRAFHLTSNYINFHDEIKYLQTFFFNNGYPRDLFLKTLKQFLNRIFSPKTPHSTVSKKLIYFSMPYYGYISHKIKKEVLNLVNQRYPQINLKMVFVNRFTIGSFFKHKERLPSDVCSGVVYKFTCDECNSLYIGSTNRQLRVRASEHMSLSCRTGMPLTSPNYSAVLDHSMKKGHRINISNFKIINSCNKYDIRILEALHIFKEKPNLNGDSPIILSVL